MPRIIKTLPFYAQDRWLEAASAVLGKSIDFQKNTHSVTIEWHDDNLEQEDGAVSLLTHELDIAQDALYTILSKLSRVPKYVSCSVILRNRPQHEVSRGMAFREHIPPYPKFEDKNILCCYWQKARTGRAIMTKRLSNDFLLWHKERTGYFPAWLEAGDPVTMLAEDVDYIVAENSNNGGRNVVTMPYAIWDSLHVVHTFVNTPS